jgi:hypothetical protein
MTIQSCAMMVVFYSSITLSLFSNVHYTGDEAVIMVRRFESKNSFISYVMINGRMYIVKQKKDVGKQRASAMREALAAYIAQDLAIAHSVIIISAEDDITGKVNAQVPATLHTIAEGKTVRKQPESKYYRLCLKQRSPQGELGPDRWLTEEIIDQMTWHEQLPTIIALDLFLSNTDRHGGNLFYDEVTDRFCAIDMDNIFRRDLPELACQKLDIMINVYKKQFTAEEIAALVQVRDTLQFLLKQHTSKQIITQLHLFAQQACGKKAGSADKKKMAKKIKHHEEMIVKSRKSIHKLIAVLDKIIGNFHI